MNESDIFGIIMKKMARAKFIAIVYVFDVRREVIAVVKMFLN